MKATSTVPARNALPHQLRRLAVPHDDDPALPMATLGSKISLERLVIRWMSAEQVCRRCGCHLNKGSPSMAIKTRILALLFLIATLTIAVPAVSDETSLQIVVEAT